MRVKRVVTMALAATMVCGMFAGCGKEKAPEENTNTQVEQSVGEVTIDGQDEQATVDVDLSEMEDTEATDDIIEETDEAGAVTGSAEGEAEIVVDDVNAENGENTEVPEATIATDADEGEWQ